jgi:hypothetical protein
MEMYVLSDVKTYIEIEAADHPRLVKKYQADGKLQLSCKLQLKLVFI